MTNFIVDKSIDHALSICFLPQYRRQIKNSFSAWPYLRVEKGIARHADTSGVVCLSVDTDGKLADKIATLLPIMVKNQMISLRSN